VFLLLLAGVCLGQLALRSVDNYWDVDLSRVPKVNFNVDRSKNYISAYKQNSMQKRISTTGVNGTTGDVTTTAPFTTAAAPTTAAVVTTAGDFTTAAAPTTAAAVTTASFTTGTAGTTGTPVIPDGEIYNAAYLGITNASDLYYLNTEYSFVFGYNPESAGIDELSGADFVKADYQFDLGGGNFRYEVHFYTADGSDMFPYPIFAPDGGYVGVLVMEVGMLAAGPNPIYLNTSFNVTLEQTIGYVDGAVNFTFEGFYFSNYTEDALRGTTVVEGVGGLGLSEIAMAWEVATYTQTTEVTTGRATTGSVTTTGKSSTQGSTGATGQATGKSATGSGAVTGQHLATATTQSANGAQLYVEVMIILVCLLLVR